MCVFTFSLVCLLSLSPNSSLPQSLPLSLSWQTIIWCHCTKNMSFNCLLASWWLSFIWHSSISLAFTSCCFCCRNWLSNQATFSCVSESLFMCESCDSFSLSTNPLSLNMCSLRRKFYICLQLDLAPAPPSQLLYSYLQRLLCLSYYSSLFSSQYLFLQLSRTFSATCKICVRWSVNKSDMKIHVEIKNHWKVPKADNNLSSCQRHFTLVLRGLCFSPW